MSLIRTNIFKRRISILILLCFTLLSSLLAGNSGSFYLHDSIPGGGYSGYRLNVLNVEILKNGTKTARFRFRLINTGKEYISLGDAGFNTLPIQVYFDTAFYQSADYVLENDFRKALLNKKATLQAGQIIPAMELKVALSRPIDAPVMENNNTSIVAEDTNISSPKAAPSKKSIKKANDEAVLPIPFDENNCTDLRIDTVRIIERSNKWILIEFIISNRGNAPAQLAGADKGSEDNIALKAFFSGTNKLTKGAVAAGGTFVKDNLKGRINILRPGDTYTAAFQMDITQRSKYTSNIVLYIDHYQLIRECDETNNIFSFYLN